MGPYYELLLNILMPQNTPNRKGPYNQHKNRSNAGQGKWEESFSSTDSNCFFTFRIPLRIPPHYGPPTHYNHHFYAITDLTLFFQVSPCPPSYAALRSFFLFSCFGPIFTTLHVMLQHTLWKAKLNMSASALEKKCSTKQQKSLKKTCHYKSTELHQILCT